MKLPQHTRYEDVPLTARKDNSWPGGRRLAFCITTDIEAFAFGKGRPINARSSAAVRNVMPQ